MKRFLYLLAFAGMVHATGIYANGLVRSGQSGSLEAMQSCVATNVSLPDSGSNKLTLLPFNTGKQELSPAVSNGYLYYFESNEGFLNARIFKISLADITESAQKKPKEFEVAQSNRHQYTYLNFTSDGKKVLLNAVDRKTGNNNLFIGDANDLASIGKLAPFAYNSKKYSVGRTTISPDGQLLVFSSDKSRSVGKLDLWLCKLKDGKWQNPENLGNLVNTDGNEIMPFFVSNTRLCFASDRHTGFGGFDLFYTDLKGNGFTLPVNMGLPVNSKYNEYGLCYFEQNGLYYFASDRRGNNDIYSYEAGSVLKNPDPVLDHPGNSVSLSKDTVNAVNLPFAELKNNNVLSDSLATTTADGIGDSVQEMESVRDNKTGDTEGYLTEKQLQESENNNEETNAPPVFEDRALGQKGYFAIQVMALEPDWYAKGYYRKELDTNKKYYLVKENGLFKIRTGNFSTYREAIRYVKENGIKVFYLVRMTKGQISEYL